MSEDSRIDWDDIQQKLKSAFDAMNKAATNTSQASYAKPYYETMTQIVDAMAKASAEQRAHAEADKFKIAKQA